MEYDTIYIGTIICPDCQIICGHLNDFQCPSVKISNYEQRNTPLTVDNLCQRFYEYDQSSMSDKTKSIHLQLQLIFLFFLFLYLKSAL